MIWDSEYPGQKVVGISSNVADDDEPFVRITESDGGSMVARWPARCRVIGIVLTRKPEDGATVVVTSRAPRGVKFTGFNPAPGIGGSFMTTDTIVTPEGNLDIGVSAEGDSISLAFDASNWNIQQQIFFEADQEGTAKLKVTADGGDTIDNAQQALTLNATEGTIRLQGNIDGNPATDFDTGDIALRHPRTGQRRRRPRAQSARPGSRERNRDRHRRHHRRYAGCGVGDPGQQHLLLRVRRDEESRRPVPMMTLTVTLTTNDIVGAGAGFITHSISVIGDMAGDDGDRISGIFVRGEVDGLEEGRSVVNEIMDGGGGNDEHQRITFTASDGNFKLKLGEQVSEEMLFYPLNPGAVRDNIDNALNAFEGVEVMVNNANPDLYVYDIFFTGDSSDTNYEKIEVLDSELTNGERTLKIVGLLDDFIVDQGENALRGAEIKVIDGAGIGQTRLIIENTADTITVANPWVQPLDDTSRIEILRYTGFSLPATLVEIVGDDGFAIDLRETEGESIAVEAPEIHGFVDTNGDGTDDDGDIGDDGPLINGYINPGSKCWLARTQQGWSS